ncbi:hypothetical protein AB6F89_22945 [Providencia hangzhouensis]|uniref:hypothetical protein n=1 Tax=Providencia hangzhouensis TaxID=3031799 RepID=UPI0034DD0E7B
MDNIYMLVPARHKSMGNEKQLQGRATERYLNTNGRWSSFPPKKNNYLLYWTSLDDAQKAIVIACSYGRKMEVMNISSSHTNILDRMVLFNDDHLPCLKGYIPVK